MGQVIQSVPRNSCDIFMLQQSTAFVSLYRKINNKKVLSGVIVYHDRYLFCNQTKISCERLSMERKYTTTGQLI